ncbi:hypothetical protein [Candidatus Nitronereus thalassa]|uniref:Uncharacterized protein n=1 Tax=Candidatus Nitronereus thalassa TaxID=3020898 RepID=A0ABU3K3C2_9BACT|nr:hypothetical protein [Candidatus Nitronereus thalassa]MDT7040874.1 hypothetical protein [Candidatus Nitronereus thalassa]
MSLPQIRSAIQSILQAVDPDSQIHDFERWEDDADNIAALFQRNSGDPFRGWVFKPVSREEFMLSHTSTRIAYVFELRFLRSVEDAQGSEKLVWDVHLEPAIAAFKQSVDLDGAAWSTGPVGGGSEYALQVDSVLYTKAGGVLCHFAKCHLTVHVQASLPA